MLFDGVVEADWEAVMVTLALLEGLPEPVLVVL